MVETKQILKKSIEKQMNKKIKVLNLHAGIGGNRKLWNNDNYEVTAVEYNQELADIYKQFYPGDKVVVADANDFLAKNWRDYDFIWASPPCQTHSKMRYCASKRGSYDAKLPNLELYEFILFLKHFCKDKLWVVENVVPYYEPLIKPNGKLGRHLVWCNFDFEEIKIEDSEVKHKKVTGQTEKYGISLRDFKMKQRKDQIIRNCVNPEIGKHLIDCAFNTKKEGLKQFNI